MARQRLKHMFDDREVRILLLTNFGMRMSAKGFHHCSPEVQVQGLEDAGMPYPVGWMGLAEGQQLQLTVLVGCQGFDKICQDYNSKP